MDRLAEFEYLQELGSGEFGRVFLCRSVLTGELRAVKHIVLDDDAGIAEWRREAEALAACRNEHVVRIHHAAATADGPVLVMDLLPGGDAARRWLPGGGAVEDVVRTLIDATWGLHHLHTSGLLHRDLKPANLLFDSEGRAVIGDFGLAGRASESASMAYLPHIPPEVIQGQPWTAAADIYALGVTGWRLLGAPEAPDSRQALLQGVLNGTWPNRDRWPLHVHGALRRTLRSAMHPEPNKRPSSAQKLREQLLRAVPAVSWSAVDDGAWAGSGAEGSFTVGIARTSRGWNVETTRTNASTARRLRAGCGHRSSQDAARSFAEQILETLASKGTAGLKR